MTQRKGIGGGEVLAAVAFLAVTPSVLIEARTTTADYSLRDATVMRYYLFQGHAAAWRML